MNATAHTNTNCLEGMSCPRCKALGPFRMATLGPKRSIARDLTQSQLLEAVATGRMDMEVYDATWTDDGSETTVGDVELVDDGPATCLCCKFQGRVCDFRSDGMNEMVFAKAMKIKCDPKGPRANAEMAIFWRMRIDLSSDMTEIDETEAQSLLDNGADYTPAAEGRLLQIACA